MVVKELQEGNSYVFWGMGEQQGVREAINANLGTSGEVS